MKTPAIRARRAGQFRVPGEAGFTLVEMLVALVIFSLIAVIGTGLARGAARGLSASEAAFAGVAGAERARALLAADCGQAARRPSLDADGRPQAAFLLTGSGFVLVRRGASGVLPTVEKVAWGFDGQRLLRQSFPAIDGAAPGPATPLIEGVQAIALRVAGAGGWQTEWSPDDPARLPRALEMVLSMADGRTLTFIVPVAG